MKVKLFTCCLILFGSIACAVESRDKTVWFEGKWGVFFHYLAIPAGTVDDGMSTAAWSRQIDDFDVAALTEQLLEVGADYFVITVGQGAGNFLAPNTVYDEFMGRDLSKSPERDLIADLADTLNPHGIKLMVYTASELGWGDLETREALGMTSHHNDHRLGLRDKDVPNDWSANRAGQIEYLKNWQKIHAHWSKQWGDKVAGWWVDGCYNKEIRFPENEPPNLGTMKAALLAGNPEAIVTFNGGKGIRVLSKHEDYTAGEISGGFPDCPGPWVEAGETRLRYHVLTYLGEKWGRGEPRYDDDAIADFVGEVTSKGGLVSLDVPALDNGRIPQAFIQQLKQIGNAVSHGTR